MSSTARNRPANIATPMPAHVWGESETSQCYDAIDMISTGRSARFSGNNSAPDSAVRRKLDTLDREFAAIMARLDRLSDSHQHLVASGQAGH